MAGAQPRHNVASLLTDPRAYGKNPSTTFNPVVPSLPGFAHAAYLLGPIARIRERLGLRQDSPAVTGGTVYIGSGDGKVYALNAATGHLRWAYTTEVSIDSGLAVADGTVYAGSNGGTVYALNAWATAVGPLSCTCPAYIPGLVRDAPRGQALVEGERRSRH